MATTAVEEIVTGDALITKLNRDPEYIFRLARRVRAGELKISELNLPHTVKCSGAWRSGYNGR